MAAKPREPTQAELTMIDRFWITLFWMDERARRRSSSSLAPRNDRLYYSVLIYLIHGYTLRDAAKACGVSPGRAGQIKLKIEATWRWFGLVMTGPQWERRYDG